MSKPLTDRQAGEAGLKLTDGHDETDRYIRLWEPKPKIRGAAEPLICEFDHGGGDHCLTADEALAYARLFRAAPDLLSALRGLLPHVFTSSPTDAQMVEHWESERDLGNGEAPLVLAAYAAIARAEGRS